MSDFPFINLHTHNPIKQNDSIEIYNPLKINDVSNGHYSFGIHPWYIMNNSSEFMYKISDILKDSQCLALGEIGIDKVKKKIAPINIQKDIFIKQLEINNEFDKPVIIHAVKSINEIIEIKKDFPKQQWIIHRFTGNLKQAEQLVECNIKISINVKNANNSNISNIPLDSLFLETDNDSIEISKIYLMAASTLNIHLEKLKEEIYKNFKKVFKV